jgi:predicted small lipoprotein YifL
MRTAHFLPLLCVALAAAACGQKGPLVLPDARTKAPVTVAKPAVPDEDKNKEKARPAPGP